VLIANRIREHRPTVILVILILLSLISLASGHRGNVVSDAMRAVVSVVAYPFYQAFAAVENAVGYAAGFVMDYDALRDESYNLRSQLDLLLPEVGKVNELDAENERLRALIDFERRHPEMTFMPAHVVWAPMSAQVISANKGVLVLDRGSMHRVEEGACAITADGIVGVITEVEPTLSYLATLHSRDCRIGAMVSDNDRIRGVLHGSGSDFSNLCRMEYVDNKESVRVGDRVLTTGGGIYPPGCLIGTVREVRRGEGLYQLATVEPAVDPFRLDEVLIVKRAQPSSETLAGPLAKLDEPVAESQETPDALPDLRSDAERLAP
jgi:rod shape-determining protein MreC